MGKTGHAVIIASVRRPEVLRDTIASVLAQVPPVDQVLVVIAADSDVTSDVLALPGVKVFKGRLGSTCQRNDGIDALSDHIETVTFLDDDVELAADYFQRVREVLALRPDVVVLNGRLLANGGIDRSEARRLIAESDGKPSGDAVNEQYGAYGCNLTVRRSVLRAERFDERFRLYGWLEDAEFAARCARHGILAWCEAARVVHLAVTGGRVGGRRMGFAQLMNAYYMYRKGLLPRKELWWAHWLPAVWANFVKWVFRDRTVDRRGRLWGNLLAIRLILARRCEPEYVEKV